MGNRALRKQASEALKKAGAPKLWLKNNHSKTSLYKEAHAKKLKKIIRLASLKPGDIVSSCDYVNHIFKEIVWQRSWTGLIWYSYICFEDGFACDCMIPAPPRSCEEIHKLLLEDLHDVFQMKELDMNDEKDIKYREDLLSGLGVTDSNGVLLNLYRKL